MSSTRNANGGDRGGAIYDGKAQIQADLRAELHKYQKKEKYCVALNDMVKELKGAWATTREERFLQRDQQLRDEEERQIRELAGD